MSPKSNTARKESFAAHSAAKAPRVLIIDADEVFKKAVEKDPRSKDFPPIFVTNAQEATNILKDATQPVAAVFLNPKFCLFHEKNLIWVTRLHRPTTPLHLLLDPGAPFPALDSRHRESPALDELFQKPINYGQMVASLNHSPALRQLDWSKLALPYGEGYHPTDEDPDEDHEFIPIRSDQFLLSPDCPFDVFVRLSPGRFVRILNCGDRFADQDVQRYAEKGVGWFFIRKGDHDSVLEVSHEIAERVLKNPSINLEVKTEKVIEFGQTTIDALKQHGVSEGKLKEAQAFVGQVQELVDQITDTYQNDALSAFMKNIAAYEHGVATTVISSMLCEAMDIDRDTAVNTIGLAALIHDIGLYGLVPERYHHEDERNMPEDIRRLFRQHPQRGADLIHEMGNQQPTIAEIVRRHHVRRNMKGFPSQSLGDSGSIITPFAEIVGFSDELQHLISESSKRRNFDPFEVMKTHHFVGFSRSIQNAFEEYFLMALL